MNAPEGLAVMRWIFDSGEITVVHVLGQSTPKIWLCSSTKLAREADGSRSSRLVDDAKVEKEPTGCQIWAMVVTMAWVAMMASMVWIAQGSADVEVPLVLVVVATNGWRRSLASMVGSSTQRALTWKSLMDGFDVVDAWMASMVMASVASVASKASMAPMASIGVFAQIGCVLS